MSGRCVVFFRKIPAKKKINSKIPTKIKEKKTQSYYAVILLPRKTIRVCYMLVLLGMVFEARVGNMKNYEKKNCCL